LVIAEKKVKQEIKLEAIQKHIQTAENPERKENLYTMKRKIFEKNMVEYNKIAGRAFSQEMKIEAWNNLLKKYNIPKYSIAVGKKRTLKFIILDLESRMAYVKGGTFRMGQNNGYEREKPVHYVRVNDFYMGKYEVTFAEYDIFCEATNRTKPDDEGWGRGNRPVINVSWDDATAYCEWLSKTTGKNYRLPTEAEWEYAAGGGSWHQKYTGTNYKNSLSSYAWYSENSGGKIHQAGKKKANRYGLYDMNGNVWEWCSDWYGDYSASFQNNPKGPSSGSERIIRGGGWHSSTTNCQVSYRGCGNSSHSSNFLGFRIVRF
ncbi:MAG: hypothetical protein CSA05_00860, partial [Bacteroidia bacterium]